jgi:hypothetical protein
MSSIRFRPGKRRRAGHPPSCRSSFATAGIGVPTIRGGGYRRIRHPERMNSPLEMHEVRLRGLHRPDRHIQQACRCGRQIPQSAPKSCVGVESSAAPPSE